jgi:hypothetical protein
MGQLGVEREKFVIRDEMEKWEERERKKGKRGVVDHNYLAPNTDYEKA